MILRDLVFENDHRLEKREGKTPVFNRGFYIAHLYLYYLGEKFVLDGCGKLTIFVKIMEKPTRKLYFDKKYYYDKYEGVSCYYLDTQDAEAYFNAGNTDKADLLLFNYTHKALIDIAEKSGCGNNVIDRINYAKKEIIQDGFSLSYEVSKLSKYDRSKKYRALVFRNINKDVGETWSVKIIDVKSNKVLIEEYLSECPTYVFGAGRYQKTCWKDNKFILSDNQGHVWSTVSL